MKNLIKKRLAWLTDQLLCLFISFITGVRPKAARDLGFSPQQKVYYANHGSHGDFVMVWISLPRRWRIHTRPVAGADYWENGRIKRFISQNVFNALLIPRKSDNPQAVVERIREALEAGDSLIIFPEGTRNTSDETVLLPFKSGIFHLAESRPQTEFVPIWIHNINKVLPKGKVLPVPLLCDVAVGEPLSLNEGESKEAFLKRTRDALLALAPPDTQVAAAEQDEARNRALPPPETPSENGKRTTAETQCTASPENGGAEAAAGQTEAFMPSEKPAEAEESAEQGAEGSKHE